MGQPRFNSFLNVSPAKCSMLHEEKLQLAGPISVIGAISCAELGAHALATWPTSPFLWYLNLEVFQSFRYSFEGFGVTRWLGGADGLAQSICVAIPLFGLVCAGLIVKVRLPLAIASNLSLIYSAALLYGTFLANESARELGFRLNELQGPSCFLATGILVVSFLSSTISHRSYWREIFS